MGLIASLLLDPAGRPTLRGARLEVREASQPAAFTSLPHLTLPQRQDRFLVSLVAQTVKNLPAMQETWVQSLGEEDPLEKGMATHSSILAWRIPWTEEPGRQQSVGLQESDMTEQLTHILTTWAYPKKGLV